MEALNGAPATSVTPTTNGLPNAGRFIPFFIRIVHTPPSIHVYLGVRMIFSHADQGIDSLIRAIASGPVLSLQMLLLMKWVRF